MRSVFMAKWDPEHALDLIEAESVTFMVGPPTFFIGLMAAAGFSLRAGGVTPADLLRWRRGDARPSSTRPPSGWAPS